MKLRVPGKKAMSWPTGLLSTFKKKTWHGGGLRFLINICSSGLSIMNATQGEGRNLSTRHQLQYETATVLHAN
jgi:hypothetical protein